MHSSVAARGTNGIFAIISRLFLFPDMRDQLDWARIAATFSIDSPDRVVLLFWFPPGCTACHGWGWGAAVEWLIAHARATADVPQDLPEGLGQSRTRFPAGAVASGSRFH